eukprot:GEMP01048103.1.p1 GENE.GEMP01048103.1~~GEMP01048103.1.p1  ORF type:complete len:148 (+),score=12.08 GEMP01048103.1:142-585(+)
MPAETFRCLMLVFAATIFEAYVGGVAKEPGDHAPTISTSSRYVMYGVFLSLFVISKLGGMSHTWFFTKLFFTSTYRYPSRKVLLVETTECAICLADFEKGDIVTRLRCSHTFHATCIHKWCQIREAHEDMLVCCSCRLPVSPWEHKA